MVEKSASDMSQCGNMVEKSASDMSPRGSVVTDEKVLEELYELLTLYFNLEFSPGGIFEKSFQTRHKIEPQLDKVIFKEKLLAIITDTIMKAKG